MSETRLAINGDIPTRTVPFPAWPPVFQETQASGVACESGEKPQVEGKECASIDDRYFDTLSCAVIEVLESGKLNYHTGEQVKAFEEAFARVIGVPHALAVANGTLALELALRACDVMPGDEVIVPSRTFIATAGAVVAVGAKPVIADVDPATNCMTAVSCAKVLTPRTTAVIPVHLGGYPAPVTEIVSLADQVGAVVIEDCAQALGARYRGMAVGSLGTAGCFSFCQDKILPLGEGGIITFKDEDAYQRAWAYRDHGRSFEKAHEAHVGEASSQFKWLNDTFGTNARMTEVQGAMGLVALGELDAWLERRARNAQVLIDAMTELDGIDPVVLPAWLAEDSAQAYYRLYARIEPEKLAEGWSRDRIIDALNAEGVPVQYGSCALISNERAFINAEIVTNVDLPGAREAHETSLAFFVHPTATVADMEDVAGALRKVIVVAVA